MASRHRGGLSLSRPHPWSQGQATRSAGGPAAGANGKLGPRRCPPTPGSSSRRTWPRPAATRPATRERTTRTFRVRHVAPLSVRAAWASAEEAIADSRRRQSAPLRPAHLCAAPCVSCRGAGRGGAGLAEQSPKRARDGCTLSLADAARGAGASARAPWASPRLRRPGLGAPAQLAGAARSLWAWPGCGSLFFAEVLPGREHLGTRLSAPCFLADH